MLFPLALIKRRAGHKKSLLFSKALADKDNQTLNEGVTYKRQKDCKATHRLFFPLIIYCTYNFTILSKNGNSIAFFSCTRACAIFFPLHINKT